MMSDASVCANHPDTVARRKCYQCLSPICPECQRRALGHIFCSGKCQILYWTSEKVTAFKQLALRISLRYRRLEKSAQKFTGGGLFRLLSISLLFFLLYQTGVIVKTLRDVSLSHPVAPPGPSLPTADIAHEGEWITVAGSAPDFAVAVLLADGKEWDHCTVSEGRYSFTFKAGGDVRSFQVQVYGDRLPTMYTRAIPVPESLAKTTIKPEIVKPEQAASAPPEAAVTASPPPKPPAANGRGTRVNLRPEDDLSRGLPETDTVAITFDGGSYSNAAGRILDVLSERGLKATFFLTGEFIERYPKVTRRIAEEGHEVGNHMYSHLHLTTFGKNFRQDTLPGITEELIRKELLRNEKAFEELTGKRMVRLWRAPYGEQNEEIRQWALKAGYRHVSWTYDPKTRKSLDGLDWVSDRDSTLYLTSEQIVRKIISFDSETAMGLAGGIVLLHLGSERDWDPFHPRLGELIDRLQEKGYKIGSVSQMLGEEG
ncbi:MAG: polysaccharide deacetylase family protein [bacterium]|nr:MAG: polysaccharide deacetylase family protein [bacterium]